jgi:hypothetical protein
MKNKTFNLDFKYSFSDNLKMLSFLMCFMASFFILNKDISAIYDFDLELIDSVSGTKNDHFNSMTGTNDGGFVVGGFSSSKDNRFSNLGADTAVVSMETIIYTQFMK